MVDIILIANLLLVLVNIALIIFILIKKRAISESINTRLMVVLFFNFLLLLAFLSWVTGYFEYSFYDLSYIYSIVILFEIIPLSIFFPRNCILDRVLISVYLIYLIMLFLGIGSIIVLTSISFLYLLTISLEGVYAKEMVKTSLVGIAFSSFGLLMQIVILYKIEIISYAILLINILYFIFMFCFFKEVYSKKVRESIERLKNPLIDLLKYFIFIILITNITLISTLSLHELGHFILSKIFGCSSQKIIFEYGSLYTDILCGSAINSYVLLGGLIFPIIVAILLFFSGGKSLKGIAVLMFGFNSMASFRDLQNAGLSVLLTYIISLVGLSLIFIGVYMLIKSRIEEQLLHISNSKKLNQFGGYF